MRLTKKVYGIAFAVTWSLAATLPAQNLYGGVCDSAHDARLAAQRGCRPQVLSTATLDL